jgi:hypothetical protein
MRAIKIVTSYAKISHIFSMLFIDEKIFIKKKKAFMALKIFFVAK